MRKIIEEVERTTKAEQNDPNYSLLVEALSVPPILLSEVLRPHRLNIESFFETIKPTIIDGAKLGRILAVLDDLENACNPDNKNLREVSVDFVDTAFPNEYKALYRNRINELENIGIQSLDQASVNIMKIVEGNTPLVRYRRDLAKSIFGLTLGFSGTELVSIPTKIPKVDLKLIYTRGINFPKASLLINPFS